VKVSSFQDATATIPVAKELGVSIVIDAIRNGGKTLKVKIGQIRNRYHTELAISGDPTKAKRAIGPLKKKLAGVTWSGTFTQRKNEALIRHSGLLCADLDSLGARLPEVRRKLKDSPHIWALFTSPTGDGLKAVFRVWPDAARHLASFRAIQKHLRELTGVEIDESCKDVSRLCFMSFDPDIYVNLDATKIEPLPDPAKSAQPGHPAARNCKPDKAQIREMLAFVPKRPHYADWIRVVAAVGDALPDDEAIELLKEWSPEEEEGEYAEKLRHRLGDVHVGTLIHLAQEHGWRSKPKSKPQPEQSDDETIKRLAAMSVLDYERCREAEAKQLRCRESVLDRLVNAERLLSNPANDALQGAAVTLADVELWPEAVKGDEILAAVAERIKHYVVLPPGAADAIALWIAHTHCFKAFTHSPRLNASSAEKQSGKSTLLDVVAQFVPRAVLTENMTTAVLFRLVSAHSPTILADEYDAWMTENEELRGLFNSGHKRGAVVHRCEGDKNDIRAFAAYAAAMLCGIGTLPGTLHDRSIVVRLTRAKRGEIQARFDERHVEKETQLCRKLARWIADNCAKIEEIDPPLPESMFNRVADNWRPLFAIAQVAGGDWPGRCVAAYDKLIGSEFEDVETLRVALLTDVQQIFVGTWPPLAEDEKPKPIERIFSKELCAKLADMTERPWPEVREGKPITERWLARNLSAFGIRPKLLRIGEDSPARGYEKADFTDTFARYVGNPLFEPLHRYNTRENEQNASVTNFENVTDTKSRSTRECNGVTDQIPPSPQMRVSQPTFDA
jgi:putative DNA primase/helicase